MHMIFLIEVLIQFQVLFEIHTVIQYISSSQLFNSFFDLLTSLERLFIIDVSQVVIDTNIN